MPKKFINPNSHRVFVQDQDGKDVQVYPDKDRGKYRGDGFVFEVEGAFFEKFTETGMLAEVQVEDSKSAPPQQTVEETPNVPTEPVEAHQAEDESNDGEDSDDDPVEDNPVNDSDSSEDNEEDDEESEEDSRPVKKNKKKRVRRKRK